MNEKIDEKKLIKKKRKEIVLRKRSHYVPTTFLVFAVFWSSQKILAKPKSDIFATISLSNNTLLGFKSL